MLLKESRLSSHFGKAAILKQIQLEYLKTAFERFHLLSGDLKVFSSSCGDADWNTSKNASFESTGVSLFACYEGLLADLKVPPMAFR